MLAGLPLSLASVVAGKERGAAEPSAHAPVAYTPRAGHLDPLYSFTPATFIPHLNTAFKLQSATTERASGLKLTKVTDLRPASGKASAAAGGRNCFSLLFRGSPKQTLAQDIYTIEHRALGEFTMLVVPVINRDKSATYYEAIINHRRP